MILKNREGLEEYYIPEDWYKNRAPGISAMIRVKDEEEWIGPCLESILPFFDEIIIGLDGSDRTRDIIKSFHAAKIKVFDYPYFLWSVDGKSYPDSIHDRAYYSNWLLSKTTKQIICKWDGDMVMLPCAYEDGLKLIAEKKNVVRICGYNPIAIDPVFILSRFKPMDQFEVRFFKINKHLFFIQNNEEGSLENGVPLPVAQYEKFTYDMTGMTKVFNPINWIKTSSSLHCYRIKNFITKQDKYVKKPMFIHTKYLKKNLRKDRKADWHDKAMKPGNVLDINLPKYMLKKPEDYL